MKSPYYVIVRFELKKGEINSLILLIQDFFKKEVSVFPGFISAKIHANEEGTVLINYATWESLEKFEQFVKELASVSEISRKIQAFHPVADGVFEVPI